MILRPFQPRCPFRLGMFPMLIAVALLALTTRTMALAEETAIIPNATPSVEPVSEIPISEYNGANPVLEPQPDQIAVLEVDPVSKRLFGFIPDYQADQKTAVYRPLTSAEKFKIARDNSFDWPNFPLLIGYSLQAEVAAGGFHQTGFVRKFGEYYARGFGDQVLGSYFTEAILPTLFHEDPRYFRQGTGTLMHRIAYATSRVFVTKSDHGGLRFYASEILGNMGVIAATSVYYTSSQTPGQGALRYGMQLGNDALTNVLTEFWPDIRYRLRFLWHYMPPH
jgi:hypothetical protein